MKDNEIADAEQQLHTASDQEIDRIAHTLSDEVLVALLNSKRNRVASAAYYALDDSCSADLVAEAYLGGRYSRFLGRVRALNRLKAWACKDSLAKACYRKALDEPKLAVSGIYGVVYSLDVESLPKIREMLASDPPENVKPYLVMAEAALAEKNPRLFKTGHRVNGERWGW